MKRISSTGPALAKSWPLLFATIIWLVLFQVPSAGAQDDMCIPTIGGLAGLPTIDGIVEGYNPGNQFDAGWNGSTRFNLSADMGTSKSAVFQVGRSSGSLFLSMVVDTPTPGEDNTVVLVFATNGTAAHDWRIHIQPFDVGMVDGADQVPFSVTYWRDSSTWNSAGATATTASPGFWLKDDTRFSKSGSRWALEMKIPVGNNPANAHLDSSVYFPNTGTFELYANILSTSVIAGTFSQDPWPPGKIVTAGDSLFLTRNTPGSSDWGKASFNSRPECTGVTLAWNDVGVADPSTPSSITSSIRRYDPAGGFTETEAQCDALADGHLWPGTKGPVNTFVARPYNTMAGSAKVAAKFYVANWGIPSAAQWRPIGEVAGGLDLMPATVQNNPSSEITIPSGTHGLLNNTAWQLSYKQSCLYSHNAHNCIQVELDSTDPDTRFLKKSVQRNMNFVSASTFAQTAEISAVGYGRAPLGRDRHEFLIYIDSIVQQYERMDRYYVPKGFKMPVVGRQNVLSRMTALQNLPDWHRISWDKIPIPVEKVKKGMTEAMTWTARGYRKTGRHLIINDRKYEYAEYVGGFGHIASHKGPVKEWKKTFKQPEAFQTDRRFIIALEQEGLYQVTIPPDQVRPVTTRIEAVEMPEKPRKCFDFAR